MESIHTGSSDLSGFNLSYINQCEWVVLPEWFSSLQTPKIQLLQLQDIQEARTPCIGVFGLFQGGSVSIASQTQGNPNFDW